jgi:uncharacterized protein (DUF1015 family)
VPVLDPFRGLRYDRRAVRMGDVVAPPYDVISSAERTTLANRHPANAVLVELPEPDLAAHLDRYQVARALLARWRDAGLLVQDPAPSLYPYKMTAADGRSSVGVIGALGLAEPGSGDVLPHEQTMSKPRSDRLDLLRATGANLSPIWGLSLAAGLSTVVAAAGPPAAPALDDSGVRHQLWVMDDADRIEAVRRCVGSAPLVIADGHHRYETALAYRQERRAAAGDAGPGPGGPATPEDAVMALVVELAEDQLTVGPIHRTISGLDPSIDIPAAFETWFDVVRAGGATDRTLAALGSAAMSLVTADGAYLLLPRAEAYAAAGSDLDSSLVDLVLAQLPGAEIAHAHHRDQAIGAVTGSRAQAAVLLRPVTVGQIAEWAAARRRMPPKTTYFSPKPRTGMVFRSLAD